MLGQLRPCLRLAKRELLSSSSLASNDGVFSRLTAPSCFYSSLSSKSTNKNGNSGCYYFRSTFSGHLPPPFGTSLWNSPDSRNWVGRRSFTQVSPTELYDIMGLTQKATPDQIKSKYFELSKIYHPDVCKDAAGVEKFVLISKAYEVLGNEEKRREYDRGIYSPDSEKGKGAERATKQSFSPEEILRYQEIYEKHHGIPKAKRSPFIMKGIKHGVYDFDRFYAAHYKHEMVEKAKLTERLKDFRENAERNRYLIRREEETGLDHDGLSFRKKMIAYPLMFLLFLFVYWYVSGSADHLNPPSK